ncbi:MAG: carnitine dehydratase [Ahrensia sp.]|nr:carnitine dehydratase [Ahrensia sp.]
MKIIEMGAIGPGPFCAMLMADLGATVLRIDRETDAGLGVKKELRHDLTRRNRPSIALDLKSDNGREAALELIAGADALIEGFRPGVMERLGLGPDICLALNPKLAYGRLTGWGQDGPLAKTVGHDINYLALTGALSMIGSREQGPTIPLNLVADLGGGALYMAFGLLAAVMSARDTGKGQVVDAAIIDGVSSMLTTFRGFSAAGDWTHEYESNFIDGGAPWYACYETADGKYISVGAVERKFYAELLDGMGLSHDYLDRQMDRASWQEQKAVFAKVFRSRSRADWESIFEGRSACFAPVLTLEEAANHPQMTERRAMIDIAGIRQPAPAPRFSHSIPDMPDGPSKSGESTAAALTAWGVDPAGFARKFS